MLNYVFAFLHGVIHPLTLLYFAEHKAVYFLVMLGIGVVTLLEYGLLSVVAKIDFDRYVKPLISITTALIGYLAITGFVVWYVVAALAAGVLVSLVSYVFLNRVIRTQQEWYKLFPVMVAAQLLAYFIPFLVTHLLAA